MNQEQTSKKLDAKAMAAADCIYAVRSALQLGGLGGVEDIEAYKDELRRIGADLSRDALAANATAKAYRELHPDLP